MSTPVVIDIPGAHIEIEDSAQGPIIRVDGVEHFVAEESIPKGDRITRAELMVV